MDVMKATPLTLLIALGILVDCSKPQRFTLFKLMPEDHTGINFENTLISTDSLNILEYLYFYNGGGVAAGDVNNDGLVDMYFAGNQVSNRLYLNKGNFQFGDITEAAGVSGEGGWSTGVTMADVSGDGLLDIYVCQVGDYKGIHGKNRLYINQGEGKFEDKAEEYGLDFIGFSTQAAFFDYDRDGDLDMYLLNHGVKSPEVFAKASNRSIPDAGGDKLFRNLASEGKLGFQDVTEESGIYSSILGFGLGIGIEDLNDDGWLDIYVSNDFTENDYLYLNQQDGTFRESLENLISSTSRYSMGNDLADLNGDGLPEILTTDMLPEDPEIWMKSVGEDKPEVYQIKKQFGYADQYVRNHLQLNQGKNGFSEIALLAGIAASDWSWSPLIVDLDNDGFKDIYITNGIVKRPNDLDFIQYSQAGDPKLSPKEQQAKQIEMLPAVKLPNYAYQSQGHYHAGSLKRHTFEKISAEWGLDQPSYSNGAMYADLDNDGDQDLIVNNINQPAFIYQNQMADSSNRFLRIDLSTTTKNTFALGAKVGVFCNGTGFYQRYIGTRGFMSGASSTLLFGLGGASQVDSIEVEWPDGTIELFFENTINKSIRLTQGEGRLKEIIGTAPVVTTTFPEIDWKHLEKNSVDETKREYLIPKSFATMGPALAVGDVNNDGLDDVYVGGAKDQPGALFLQQQDGMFQEKENKIFTQLAPAEDVVAEFADFNGDGNLDLYVGGGGNEHASGSLLNFDRLLVGNGRGEFQFNPRALPGIGENTSTIAIHDVDGDGDLDIFVGSSVVTGDYGASPKSSLLINRGNGDFQEKTEDWFGGPKISRPIGEGLDDDGRIDFGMINSATWADLNNDGKKELILTGDWQDIRVFEIRNDQTIREKNFPGLEYSSGWIQSVSVADVNNDGRKDILTGNLGLNSKLKASREKPVWLYHGDFDENNQADPLIFHYMEDRLLPFATRDDLIKQIPKIKKMHNSYESYAAISNPTALLSKKSLEQAAKQAAYNFQSGAYLQQENGDFLFIPFPDQAQFSPVYAVHWDSSNETVYLGGNFSGFRADLGINTAAAFSSYTWKNNHWVNAPFNATIPAKSEIRALKKITVKGKNYILVASNSDPLYWCKLP